MTAPYIRVDHLLQIAGIAQSGGEAGFLVKNGLIRQNGRVLQEKRKKVYPEDEVDCNGKLLIKIKALD